MSETIYKIIPNDYFFSDDKRNIEGAVRMLEMYLPGASITWEKYETPVFVDCGGNLEEIACPNCGKIINTDDWQEMMNHSDESSQFIDLSCILPCCGKASSLNNLLYNMDCGFAKIVIEIVSDVQPCKHDLYEAGKCFGKFGGLKMIIAHY